MCAFAKYELESVETLNDHNQIQSCKHQQRFDCSRVWLIFVGDCISAILDHIC
jgi:hypothetical protein